VITSPFLYVKMLEIISMILGDLILSSRSNQYWKYSGLDSFNECIDKKYFLKYPHEISYEYNSRGFRDSEWPDSLAELSECIWCIGDSFTVGLGQPYDHIWPQVLQRRSKRRTINISMDGASNDWILRRTQQIIDEINPKNIVLMWSYLHRRESEDTSLSDENRRLLWNQNIDCTDILDYLYWKNQRSKLNQFIDNIIEFSIPNYCLWHNPDDGVILVPQLDYARDHHHFDIKTSEWIVDKMHSLFL
jgi:hypothetical protein